MPHVERKGELMVLREITYEAIILRLLSSILIGGIIGLERGMKNRPAGLRTYMLVCVGSCLIMLTNQYIYQVSGAGDPMRLGAQVVSGIGFLGGGTIIVTKHNQIRGLTTAAGLWSAAGVGLALGVGFYEGAFTASIGIYVILTILHRWEGRAHRRTRLLDFYMELDKSVQLGTFIRSVRELDFEIQDIQHEPDGTQNDGARAYIASVKSKNPQDHLVMTEKIRNISGVVYMEEL